MRYLVFLIILISIQSCVQLDFKNEYIEVDYYTLNQPDLESVKNIKVDKSLMIRNFTVASEFDTEYLFEKIGEYDIEIYQYHRWLELPAPLFTDYVTKRIVNSETFSSVLQSGSFAIPDLIIEAHILEIGGYQVDKDSYSIVKMNVNVLKNNPKKDVLFSKMYEQIHLRNNNKASSIPEAISIGIAKITDQLILDIQDNIND